jgi:hypothetical protein
VVKLNNCGLLLWCTRSETDRIVVREKRIANLDVTPVEQHRGQMWIKKKAHTQFMQKLFTGVRKKRQGPAVKAGKE